MSWQNDQTSEGMGKYMQDAGIKSVYMLAPNYQAGKDMLTVSNDISKAKLLAKFTPNLVKVIFRPNCLRCAQPNQKPLSYFNLAAWL